MLENDLQWCLEALGVTAEDLVRLSSATDAEHTDFSVILQKAKRGYRQACRDLHPDLNGGSPEKTTRFRVLTDVYKTICAAAPPDIPRTTKSKKVRITVRFRL